VKRAAEREHLDDEVQRRGHAGRRIDRGDTTGQDGLPAAVESRHFEDVGAAKAGGRSVGDVAGELTTRRRPSTCTTSST